jgi:succinate dehydrogenase / fumarate reductase, membrane anchor subunit
MTDDKKSIRTPLGRARGMGSAKGGTHHWWMQRVTAVALVPLVLVLLGLSRRLLPDPQNLGDLIALIQTPWVAALLAAGIIIGFYHAALGMQVIIEDYVHSEGSKIVSLMLNKIFFFFAGIAALAALCSIAFAH